MFARARGAGGRSGLRQLHTEHGRHAPCFETRDRCRPSDPLLYACVSGVFVTAFALVSLGY
ncbi:hypothetical protein J2X36_004573 [Methylobacterium sp. BE186]|nr:hypothetical protein [Methylobacterium sp. BE186]